MEIREPTAEECETNALIAEDEYQCSVAIWYPQMGGYVGKAVATFGKSQPDGCFDVVVWHDGDWPFHAGEPGVKLHHCCAEQFINFGETMKAVMAQSASGGREKKGE